MTVAHASCIGSDRHVALILCPVDVQNAQCDQKFGSLIEWLHRVSHFNPAGNTLKAFSGDTAIGVLVLKFCDYMKYYLPF